MVLQRTFTASKDEPTDDAVDLEKFKVVVKDVFKQLDNNNDGRVDREEVREALQALVLPARAKDVDELFATFDLNQDGVILYDEFEALALHRRYGVSRVWEGVLYEE
ncbi:unnamed protein product [Choristocarpus tenellus]